MTDTKVVRCPEFAKDYCMCGSPIDHSVWEGHSPVSQWDHLECNEVEEDWR